MYFIRIELYWIFPCLSFLMRQNWTWNNSSLETFKWYRALKELGSPDKRPASENKEGWYVMWSLQGIYCMWRRKAEIMWKSQHLGVPWGEYVAYLQPSLSSLSLSSLSLLFSRLSLLSLFLSLLISSTLSLSLSSSLLLSLSLSLSLLYKKKKYVIQFLKMYNLSKYT